MIKDIVMWLLVALMAWSCFITVSMIGKPREPINNNMAITTIIINAIMIFSVLYVGGAL